MLVCLPPSEGKAAPRRGRPLDLDALAYAAELGERRAAVLDLLDPALRDAPAAKASAIYTGVLFAHLGLAEMPLRARRRVLVFSALWGVVRPDDRIPAYRLPIGDRLDGLATTLAAHWRPALTTALPDEGLVVDLRSGGYAAAWRPRHAEVLTVRGFTEDARGARKVISHMVKATRGDVARIVLSAPRPPRSAGAVADLVAAAGHEVELTPLGTGHALDVVVRASAASGGDHGFDLA